MFIHRFYKIIFIIFFPVVFSGCATKHPLKNPAVQLPPQIMRQEVLQSTENINNGKEQPISEQLEVKWVVFFKTDFKGLLETNYVRLTISPSDDSSRPFDIHLGDISKASLFSGGHETLKPGYIYLELPEGEYRIESISIPVVTTLAVEKLNLAFTVQKEVVNYLGTLSFNGTKERIKLGGVPVIKPGFDYQMEIRDERIEAFADLGQKYPTVKSPKNVSLIQIGKNG